VLKSLFAKAKIEINHDLTAAARALCGKQKGIACILGTGANAGYFNGNKIAKNSPGLGYILGDEGSGAYLGKKSDTVLFVPNIRRRTHGRFYKTL